MSTLDELFAPKYVGSRYNGTPTSDMLKKMAKSLGVDTLRYLSVEDLGKIIGTDNDSLCLGCVTGRYPTRWGYKSMERARKNHKKGGTGRSNE